MSIHSKGQNPKTWKPSEEIFVSALELVLASLTLVVVRNCKYSFYNVVLSRRR